MRKSERKKGNNTLSREKETKQEVWIPGKDTSSILILREIKRNICLHLDFYGYTSCLRLEKENSWKNKQFAQTSATVMGDQVSDKLLAHPVQGVPKVFNKFFHP
jgi:hypothetical protein